ncbi:outer membrane beta-barrel protein [Aquimarina sediminis]|uniref:outer membrane beta-barrel protein n=1 Tax=Aquimarina sediminis TaxID=2070536 RepID=UPI000CA07399|nr:outer membrane beta-barrel protein [Aquimarina sediminis]
MSDKKNIDRLFQEKFKDFDVTPDEIVWEKIKAHQSKDKKRGLLLPFWYKVAGVAALITVLFGIGYLSFYNNSLLQQNNTLTNSDSENTTQKASDKYLEPSTPSQEVLTTSEKDFKESENPSTDSKKESDQHTFIKPAITKESIITKTAEIPEKNISAKEKSSPFVTSDPTNKKGQLISHKKQNTNDDITEPSTLSPKENNVVHTNGKKAENTITNDPDQNPKSGKEHSFFTTPNKKDIISPQGLAENHLDQTDKETTSKEPLEDLNNNGKKSIFDAINKDKETVVEESKTAKKWNISPNIAPVYYNTIGNGSSIDKQFADNSKDGQVNISYGVQVSYALNDKFSVRSGVHKVDLSYNTEGVGFSPSAIGQNLENVDYNTTAGAILISDIGRRPSSSEFSEISRNAVDRTQNPGLLNQSIGYIEVPLEMEYAIIDKKIGVNMIGGVSTLFLQNNEVSIEAGDFETPIGSANNLNDVSFSGNIGLGVDYQLSDHLEVNLEPIFKYQFNAVNNSADTFRPYYFGVYTGVSIKF